MRNIFPESYTYSYSIIGTPEILEFIVNEAGLSHYQIRGFDHKKCYELKIWSKGDVEIFHNYIYRDKDIFLDRKYYKSLSMMKWCELNTARTETQELADLLDCNLYYDTTILGAFDCCSLKLSETAAMADLLD